MNEMIKLVLSLSLSASILVGILFAMKPLIKHRLSKSLQYGLWIVVLLRLLVPFSFQGSVMNNLFHYDHKSTLISYDKYKNNEANNETTYNNVGVSDSSSLINQNVEKNIGEESYNKDNLNSEYLKGLLIQYVIYIWFIVTTIILTVNVVGYVRFLKYLKKGYVSPKENEERVLSTLINGRSNIRLLRNKYISTPMLIGVLRPYIIIPNGEFNEVQIKNILLHEITHQKHFDIVIKWLTMIATSIHWFNPLVYFLKKELNSACELACDEAVIKNLNKEEMQDYGDTLISLAEEVKYPKGALQATMCEEKRSLKERLVSIMEYNRKSKSIIIFSAILLVSTILGAICLGGVVIKGKDVLPNNISTEEETKPAFDLKEISKYKTPYVGDGSKVSNIARLLPVPSNYFKQQHISLKTDQKPYGLTMYYEPAGNKGYNDEWPIPKSNNGMEDDLIINSLVLFSMIDNLDEVTYMFRNSQSEDGLNESKYDSKFSFSREMVEDKYGELSRFGENIVLLQDTIEGKKSVMKGLELYVWRKPELTGNDDIYYTLLIGTNRIKDRSEILNMDIATSELEVIKKELSEYNSETYLSISCDKDINEETILKIKKELLEIIKNTYMKY